MGIVGSPAAPEVTGKEIRGGKKVKKKKTFADVGDLLTTSVSAWLSKDSGFIHLIHMIQSQEQHNSIPYTLELDLGPFPPDVVSSFPPE